MKCNFCFIQLVLVEMIYLFGGGGGGGGGAAAT
jgi:hypothetical protein